MVVAVDIKVVGTSPTSPKGANELESRSGPIAFRDFVLNQVHASHSFTSPLRVLRLTLIEFIDVA